MDDSPLKVVSFQRDPADAEVVEYLQKMVSLAESGELRAVSIIAVHRYNTGEVTYGTGHCGTFPDRYAVMGMLQYAIHRVAIKLDGERE